MDPEQCRKPGFAICSLQVTGPVSESSILIYEALVILEMPLHNGDFQEDGY